MAAASARPCALALLAAALLLACAAQDGASSRSAAVASPHRAERRAGPDGPASKHRAPAPNFDPQSRRILVTGGAGFIGSHLVERLLEQNHHVIVLDSLFTGSKRNIPIGHPHLEFVRQDVIDPFFFEVDQIFHLACPASPIHYKYSPVHTIRTSVVGMMNVLGLAKRTEARVVFTSTSEVYGDPLEHPQVETYWGNVNPIGERACYDEGKRAAETLAFDYSRQEAVDVRVARVFNTYGPRMALNDGRVVSNFVAQALQGQSLSVEGTGDQTRSFCYVSDLVEGLLRLMNKPPSARLGVAQAGPINLGNPGEFTIRQLADEVRRIVPTAAGLKFVPATADDPKQRKPSIAKAKELLGWAPKVSLQEGLALMVEDFRRRVPEGNFTG